MEYAASIRYGGQLFSASDCNHGDFLNLGLICPNCKDSVFLRMAHSRLTSQGKAVAVRAQFVHRADTNPILVKQCEARVSKYSVSEIQRRTRNAANQRLKLLQQWFWKVFLTYNRHYVCELPPNPYEITNECLELFVKFLDNFATKKVLLLTAKDHFCELFTSKSNRGQLHSWLDTFCNEYVTGVKKINPYESWESKFILQQKLEIFRNSVDLNMHRLIVKEVLEFLSAKSSKPLLEKVFWYQEFLLSGDTPQQQAFRETFQEIKNKAPHLKEYEIRANCHLCPILRLLSEVAWADAFSDLSQKPIKNNEIIQNKPPKQVFSVGLQTN